MRNYWRIIIILLAFTFSLTGVYILAQEPGGHKDEAKRIIFRENERTYLHINNSGDAICQYTDRISESKLSKLVKQTATALGEEKMKETFINSIRSNFSTYGMEADNITGNIQGLGQEDPFELSLSWRIPGFAQREDNHWSISFVWVDAKLAARRFFSQVESTWVTIRNAAQAYNLPHVTYELSSEMHIILPENSFNVSYSPSEQASEFRFGGGTYSEYSLYKKQENDKLRIVENGVSKIVMENRITATPTSILENSKTFSITYKKRLPENWGFLDSISSIRLDLKYGKKLDEKYSISESSETEYRLSPKQILYYMADKLVSIKNGSKFSMDQPPSVNISGSGESSWKASWKPFSKSEYLDLAQSIKDNIESGSEVKTPVNTTLGKIDFRDLLYTFARVLSSYKEDKILLSEIKFAPSPYGNLSLAESKISSKVAYFLLPSPDVITNSATVENILTSVEEPGYDNKDLARELNEWTHENISYNFSVFGSTSEEILSSGEGRCESYVKVYLALTRSSRIPSREVSGWVVSGWTLPSGWEFVVGETPEGSSIAGHSWAQVYIPGQGWIHADPTGNYFETPNTKYIYLWKRRGWKP